MAVIKDRTGHKVGLLTITSLAHCNARAFWNAKCECGNTIVIDVGNIKRYKSCGCLRRNSKHRVTHNMTGTRVYTTWTSMIGRCSGIRKECKQYKKYKGRGITVCERWKKFENFFEDMGDRPEGMSIDRIDNDKGYYKENCRWATPKEQANNTRSITSYEYKGEMKTLTELAKISSTSVSCMHRHIKNSNNIEETVASLIKTKSRRKSH